MNEVLEKWGKRTRMLEGLSECRKEPVAQCLEVQLHMNNMFDDSFYVSLWGRISIPLIRRIFGHTNNLFQCPLIKEEHSYHTFKTKCYDPYTSREAGARMSDEADLIIYLQNKLITEINELFKNIETPINFYGLFCTSNNEIVMWYEV